TGARSVDANWFNVGCLSASTLDAPYVRAIAFTKPGMSNQTNHRKKETDHATRDDRTGQNGRQHGAAFDQARPPVRGLRQVAGGGAGSGQGESRRGRLSGG